MPEITKGFKERFQRSTMQEIRWGGHELKHSGNALEYLGNPAVSKRRSNKPSYFAVTNIFIIVEKLKRIRVDKLASIILSIELIKRFLHY